MHRRQNEGDEHCNDGDDDHTSSTSVKALFAVAPSAIGFIRGVRVVNGSRLFLGAKAAKETKGRNDQGQAGRC